MHTFAELDGRWYCLAALEVREEDSNAQVVVRWLTDPEVGAYHEARAAGLDDLATYLHVFPEERPRPSARAHADPLEPPIRPTTRFTRVNGAVFAAVNGRERDPEDAAVWKALTPEQAKSYEQRTARGERDSAIFRSLFAAGPPPATGPRQITIDVSSLSKPQLVKLVELRLGAAMPSLERASREDLERLLLGLHA